MQGTFTLIPRALIITYLRILTNEFGVFKIITNPFTTTLAQRNSNNNIRSPQEMTIIFRSTHHKDLENGSSFTRAKYLEGALCPRVHGAAGQKTVHSLK